MQGRREVRYQQALWIKGRTWHFYFFINLSSRKARGGEQTWTTGLSLGLGGMGSVDAILNRTVDLTHRRFVWLIHFCWLLPSTKFDSRVCLQALPPSTVANDSSLLTYSARVLSSCCAPKSCLPCEQLPATLFGATPWWTYSFQCLLGPTMWTILLTKIPAPLQPPPPSCSYPLLLGVTTELPALSLPY